LFVTVTYRLWEKKVNGPDVTIRLQTGDNQRRSIWDFCDRWSQTGFLWKPIAWFMRHISMNCRGTSVMRDSFSRAKRVAKPKPTALIRGFFVPAILRFVRHGAKARWQVEGARRKLVGKAFYNINSKDLLRQSIRVGQWTEWAFEVSLREVHTSGRKC
jgi:hypothetical protein